MKRRNSLKWAAVAAGTLAATTCATNTQAQSADALLDKLVDKGILSQKEANELRDESDAGFRKAYQVKSGMPDFVTALKINGDFRGRVDHFESENENFVDRIRYRYRLRLGVVATLNDNLEAGVRLTSSDPSGSFGGDPISGNSTMQDNGSKKFVYLDMAYGKWSFLNTRPVTAAVTVGKMENPFIFSDSVFDNDYTPEGVAFNFTHRLNDEHTLKLNAGAFLLDELGGDSKDPYMYGVQVRWDAAWSKKVATTMGLAALNIVNEQSLTNGAVPAVNRGNTRNPGTGVLANNFNPIVVDAAVTYTFEEAPLYNGAFPIKFAGEYMNNVAISDRNQGWQAGVTLGKAGKKGLWELAYRYKYSEADVWFEEFADSDFGAYYAGTLPNSGSGAGYGAGTNLRGHVAKLSYSPFDALTLSAAYYRANVLHQAPTAGGVDRNSDTGRLIVDAVWKF